MRKVGREKAQEAQKLEGVTELTERGHRGSRRRAEEVTERIPPSDRPRSSSCATDRRSVLHRRRTELRPRQSLPRIDLGMPPVPPIREGFFTGDDPSKNRDNSSLGSTSVCLLCRRSDKSFSPEANRPEPEGGPRNTRNPRTDFYSREQSERRRRGARQLKSQVEG